MRNRSGIGKQTAGSGGGGIFVNTNNAEETIGGFVAGEQITPEEGLTFQQFGDKLLSPVDLPSLSINVSNQIIEKGTNISQNVVLNFNQNDAGALSGLSLRKNGTEISTNASTAFTENEVLSAFTLQGVANYQAGSSISAGSVSSPLRTITPVNPQWKGQKANNTSLDGSTYSAFNSALTKIVQSGDNTSITVSSGQYGVFISINPNATIIEDGTGFAIAPSAFTKNTITAKLANGDDVTLTEYIINPATSTFTYNLQ